MVPGSQQERPDIRIDRRHIKGPIEKKGLVQYQFEMADKEEENCFKGLYDALNQLF